MSYLSDLFGGMCGEAQANDIQCDGGALVYIDTSTFSGAAITFQQNISLESSYTGIGVTFRQTVAAEFYGAAAVFNQTIKNESDKDFSPSISYVKIIVGDDVWDTKTLANHNGLCDMLTMTGTENQSRQLTFSVIPPEGVQDVEYYQNKPVKVIIKNAEGVFTLFTGFVDVPALNITERKVTFTCSDRRTTQIIQLDPSILQYIGYYSIDISGVPTDAAEELEKRLESIPYSFDFTNAGNWTLTPWQPKNVADFTMGNDGFYWRQPSVKYTSRLKTINTVNLTLSYTFQRLHQQCCHVIWNGYNDFCADWFSAGKPSFPQISMINSAAYGGSWSILTTPTLNYVPVWAAAFYSCNGGVEWQPNKVTHTYQPRRRFTGYQKDSSGGFVTYGPSNALVPVYEDVKDVNGNQIMDIASTTITDTSSQLCRGVSWDAALRFAQTVTEEYNITVQAPQSTEIVGVIDQSQKIDVTDTFDTTAWETDKQISFVTRNFYADQKASYGSFLYTYKTAIQRAKMQILSAHRDVVVSFSRPLWGPIDLQHTVEIDAETQVTGWTQGIACKGKVGSFTHTIDFGQSRQAVTSVELWLSRAEGTATETPLAFVPVVQDPSYIGTHTDVILGTHLGQNPDPAVTPGAQSWNGYIGNKETTVNNYTSRTQFNESFVIDYPSIPESIRGALKYTGENSFDILIPNDDLEVSF